MRLGLSLAINRGGRLAPLFGADTPAGLLLGDEPSGFAIDFDNDSVLVRGHSTEYSGNVAGFATFTGSRGRFALSAIPFSATAGTVICDAEPTSDDSVANTSHLWIISTNSTVGLYRIRNQTANLRRIVATVRAASVDSASIVTGDNAVAAAFSSAFAWAADDAELVLDGVSIFHDTAVVLPTGLTDFNIGESQAEAGPWGTIHNLTYIPRRLSQAELIARTA